MTVRGYLRFVASLKGVTRGQMTSELDRVAQATGTTEVLDRLIQNLSKGFRQRVGLAQALLGSPRCAILDEPTEGLDPSQRAEVRQLIKGLAGQHTVILSTHILPEVTMTCERVLILNQGTDGRLRRDPEPGSRAGPGRSRPRLEDIFLKLTAAA